MPLLYIIILLVILSVLAIITSKSLKKNKIFIIGIIILPFAIIFGIGFYIWSLHQPNIEYERNFLNESNNSMQTETNKDEDISTGENLNGKIINIDESYIYVQKDDNSIKKVKIDNSKQLLNARTGESIQLSEIKIGDYFTFNKIVRNISGNELILELYKSISSESTTLYLSSINIKSIEKRDNYYITTVQMEDASMKYFEKDNRPIYECQFIINESTKYYPENKNISIDTLQEMTKDNMFTIILDKNTVNDEYPVISKIDIYDL